MITVPDGSQRRPSCRPAFGFCHTKRRDYHQSCWGEQCHALFLNYYDDYISKDGEPDQQPPHGDVHWISDCHNGCNAEDWPCHSACNRQLMYTRDQDIVDIQDDPHQPICAKGYLCKKNEGPEPPKQYPPAPRVQPSSSPPIDPHPNPAYAQMAPPRASSLPSPSEYG